MSDGADRLTQTLWIAACERALTKKMLSTGYALSSRTSTPSRSYSMNNPGKLISTQITHPNRTPSTSNTIGACPGV